MKLPIISQPEYISPTAYKIWKICQFKYFKKYLSGERTKFPQSIPMAIGSAFDAIVKSNLAKDLNWYNKDKLSKEVLIEQSVDKELRSVILKPAEEIFAFYKACGAYQSLINEQVMSVECEELRLVREDKFSLAVPIFGKPDCLINNPDHRILDWKVNGYGSKYGATRKKGYSYCYSHKGVDVGKDNLPMELIDEDWAIQLTTYNWILQKSEFLEFNDIPVAIDQIAIKGDDIKIVTYRTIVTSKFQEDLFLYFKLMWASILNGEIEDPTPSKQKCYMYGQWCEVKEECPKYKSTFGDDSFNKLL